MAGTKSRKPAKVSQSQKTCLSSDCSLQLDCIKSESLVIAYQHDAVGFGGSGGGFGGGGGIR